MNTTVSIPMMLCACLAIAGCESKPSPSTTAAAPAPAAAGAKERPKAKAQAKTKLDAKPAAPAVGTATEIPGTNGVFTIPATWKSSNHGDWVIAGVSDEQGGMGIAVTKYAKGEDPTAKLGALATAASFTDCEWNTPEDATIGEAELPAKVSDGVCMQEGKWNNVMYALIPGDDLNVFLFAASLDTATDAQTDELVKVVTSLKKK